VLVGWQKAALLIGLVFGLEGCAAQNLAVGSLGPSPLLAPPSFGRVLQLSPATPMPTSGREAAIPSGYLGFCARMPDQCQIPLGAAQSVTLTPSLSQTLQAVNQDVNSSIWPEDDERHYGRAEYWTIPSDGYGDCEDYALAKRKKLLDAGLSPAALRIAVAITSNEERHAVLTVVTDKGDYVLDNLRSEVMSWDQTGYLWVERQSPTKSLAWEISDADLQQTGGQNSGILTTKAR
jgi:predicted transglutaminase-like cysteine proteinase